MTGAKSVPYSTKIPLATNVSAIGRKPPVTASPDAFAETKDETKPDAKNKNDQSQAQPKVDRDGSIQTKIYSFNVQDIFKSVCEK